MNILLYLTGRHGAEYPEYRNYPYRRGLMRRCIREKTAALRMLRTHDPYVSHMVKGFVLPLPYTERDEVMVDQRQRGLGQVVFMIRRTA